VLADGCDTVLLHSLHKCMIRRQMVYPETATLHAILMDIDACNQVLRGSFGGLR